MNILNLLFRKSRQFRSRLFFQIPITKIPSLEKIGSEYGGWVIPTSLITSKSICYLAGTGEDISFDIGLAQRFKTHVWMFDPTPKAEQYFKENFCRIQKNDTELSKRLHYQKIGLWDQNKKLKFYQPQKSDDVSHSIVNLQKTDLYFWGKVMRLVQVMKSNHHKRLDLLKLDIEGAEYAVLESIIADKLDINVLCVEFDEVFNHLNSDYKKRIHVAIQKLLDVGYVLVNIDGLANMTFVRRGVVKKLLH